MERAAEAGRGLASGDVIRGAAETRGCGATGGLGAGAAGAGADHGSGSRSVSFWSRLEGSREAGHTWGAYVPEAEIGGL